MSTTPLYPPPPPDTTSTQQAYASSAAHGSVGPVIGVLAVITVLGVLAGMVGRMCSGKPVMGYGGHYDLEGWVETKCASCIDGRVEPPPRPNRPVASVPMAAMSGQSQEASGEIKEGEVEGADDHHHHNNDDDDEEDVEEHQEEEEKDSRDRN